MKKLFEKIYDYVYWTFHRPSNILKIDTIHRGYSDITEVMLHANFQLLVNFVEKELNSNIIQEQRNVFEEIKDFEVPEERQKQYIKSVEEYNHAFKRIRELYHWWKFERPNRSEGPDFPKEFDSIPFKDCFNKPEFRIWADEYHATDEKNLKEDNENLNELISLRGYLWT